MQIKPQSKHFAVIVSYVTTVLTALASIVLIPVCLKNVGADQYGLYQKIYAVSQYLMIIDIGISTTIIRYSTAAREKKDIDLEMKLYGYMFRVTVLLNVILCILGAALYLFIDVIYNNMSAQEIMTARQLLLIMIIHSVLTVFQDYAIGISDTYEQFIFSNSLKLFRMAFRLIAIPIGIVFTKSILTIAIVDAALMGVTLIASFLYNTIYVKAKLRFARIDTAITKGAIVLMFANLLQNVSKFLNNGIDKILLGRLMGNTAVTTYSIAMTFISFYMIVSTVIQTVHYPEVIRMNERGASIKELTNIAVKVGRVQFILCGGILCAFALLGKEFIKIWSGSSNNEAWYIAIIIMIPLIIPLTQNVCLCILTAKDKRLFRSIVVVGLSLVNVVASIILIKQYGLLGAPIGTAIAYFVGNVVAMNLYYKFKIGIPVFSMFFEIFRKTLPSLIVASIISVIIYHFFTGSSLLIWVSKAVVFVLIYVLMLMIYGLNNDERQAVKRIFRKFIKTVRN